MRIYQVNIVLYFSVFKHISIRYISCCYERVECNFSIQKAKNWSLNWLTPCSKKKDQYSSSSSEKKETGVSLKKRLESECIGESHDVNYIPLLLHELKSSASSSHASSRNLTYIFSISPLRAHTSYRPCSRTSFFPPFPHFYSHGNVTHFTTVQPRSGSSSTHAIRTPYLRFLFHPTPLLAVFRLRSFPTGVPRIYIAVFPLRASPADYFSTQIKFLEVKGSKYLERNWKSRLFIH